MSVVNLEKRMTQDEGAYHENKQSADSLIYIAGEDGYERDQSGPDCLSLSVGRAWYDRGRYIAIDQKRGLKVRPKSSVVVETKEKIALPFNVYGLLFGAGKNIYSGCFVSGGKIDPGYKGYLRIGFYNGSDQTITLKPGAKLAYCLFFTTESCLAYVHDSSGGRPDAATIGKKEVVKRWFLQHVYEVISTLIAISSVCIAFLAFLKK